MNFRDFDSAITRAKAYKIPCVICKLTNPDTPIKRRNPFFILKIESFHFGVLKIATVEACTVPLTFKDIVHWESSSKIETHVFRRR
jgi:hypothetical protein